MSPRDRSQRNRQPADLLIEGGTVIAMDAERRIYDPGTISIRQGRVVEIGPCGSLPGSAKERIDATNMVVMPGLLNAHSHLTPSVYRSCFDEKPDSRDAWLRMARGLTRQRARQATALTLLEQVRYGTTTTHESHMTHYHPDSTDGICEAIQQSGMRAVVARSMNDKAEYTAVEFLERYQDALDDLDRLEREWESDLIRIIPEAATVLRCTPEAVLAMREWAIKRDKIWHIHLAQNNAELREALRTVGMGSVQYAAQLGVLGPEMLAAHCSGLLEDEVELLGERQVRIAHCPVPMMRGGQMVPPIWELERLGARVAIATDGSSTNNGQNLWEAMKMAVYMQRVRSADRHLGTAEQALEMATIKAARVLDLEQKVGSLEPGKEADIAMFRRDQPHLATDAMLVSNLVYAGGNNLADTVLVGGRVILQRGRSTVLDEEEVLAGAREAQREMLREAGLEGEIGLTSSWPVIIA